MYSPVCFSQYFTNKQNVRSLNNIFNLKLLQSGNEDTFLEHVIGDKNLLQNISPEILKILKMFRYNIKCCSKQDFKEFLAMQVNKQESLSPVNKVDVFKSCINALTSIIPYKFFNSNHNTKIFKKYVQLVIYSMNRQHIQLDDIVKQWDVNMFPWNSVTFSVASKIIYNAVYWIFKNVLSAIITLNFFVTTCKIDVNENRLYFFWKNQWQAYYDKKISDMVIMKIISRFEPHYLKKKLKILQHSQRIKSKIFKRNIPKLHLVLKTNHQYRPIVCYKNEQSNQSEKYKIKERLHFIQLLTGKVQDKIENQYKNLYKKWQNKNCPSLYFVKTDLSNAFGSINKAKLLKVLEEKYFMFQKKEMPLYLKKKYLQCYKELITELSQPLLIRAGSTIYEWKKGLVQGYKYSPALSELYYTYFDEIYFSELIQDQELSVKLFIRVVDDYLFVTDSLEEAHIFLKALSNYKNINFDKTLVNFPHPTVKCSQKFAFLGYSYNTANLQVSRIETVFAGQVWFKLQFSAAVADLESFLENRIGQSGINLNSHIFNFYHNNEEHVWKQLFVTLCFSANKFCCILAIQCDEKNMVQYLPVYKKRVTVKLCNSILDTLRYNRPRDFNFIYCINHFRYLSFKALLLCARHTPKCNILVPFVNIEVAKTNCIFGKWRKHSSRIAKDGQNQREAVKDICRRSDLRKIMKSFDTLPTDLNCFDHRKFYQ